jgi:hypothetical protein
VPVTVSPVDGLSVPRSTTSSHCPSPRANSNCAGFGRVMLSLRPPVDPTENVHVVVISVKCPNLYRVRAKLCVQPYSSQTHPEA